MQTSRAFSFSQEMEMAKAKKSLKKTAKNTTSKKTTSKKTAGGKAAKRPAAKKVAAKKASSSRKYVVRSSKIQGRGVFADRLIKKGELIGEYTGERITEKEADRRYPFDDDERHHTFLFRLDDGMIIDALFGGNAVRFINHSCDPNCEALEEDGRILISALRNIPKGQELAYDYNFILDERHTPKAKAQYPCYCGSKKCRGTILAKKR
jgi:SET domain-containing protein